MCMTVQMALSTRGGQAASKYPNHPLTSLMTMNALVRLIHKACNNFGSKYITAGIEVFVISMHILATCKAVQNTK